VSSNLQLEKNLVLIVKPSRGAEVVRAYRNISFATADSFKAVLDHGAVVTVRGEETRELRNRVTPLARPFERCVFLPGRRNDVFAQVAETLWVIAGRNDLAWLSLYLDRAPEFSDDGGKTWRGAYGPRLRMWPGGVDQLDEWRRLLIDDRASRRAVGVIFDPARDFVESRDIPCNNWLSWLIRDDRLHLNVGIRSNDAMWGFSGVNAFEWSVLQEMMAFWVNANVGEATFFATSYHIYKRHYDRAHRIVERFYGVSPYDFGISSPRFSTPWPEFAEVLEDWFSAEAELRAAPGRPLREGRAMQDPFLASTLRLLRLKWGALSWTPDQLASELAALPEDDFATAAYEMFGRSKPDLLTAVPQPNIRAFFDACRAAAKDDADTLRAAIKHLHARKNASYASSWKRRGERVSVVPNIARKVDRLQAFVDYGQALEGETVIDTALDLFVYAAKYRLLLAEQAGADRSFLIGGLAEPFSDHDASFNHLVDAAVFIGEDDASLTEQVGRISGLFEQLWPAVEAGAPLADRERLAAALCQASERLIGHLAAADKRTLTEFIHNELRV